MSKPSACAARFANERGARPSGERAKLALVRFAGERALAVLWRRTKDRKLRHVIAEISPAIRGEFFSQLNSALRGQVYRPYHFDVMALVEFSLVELAAEARKRNVVSRGVLGEMLRKVLRRGDVLSAAKRTSTPRSFAN